MTPRQELLRPWAEIDAHLESAFRMLPERPASNPEGGSVAGYREYLDHNELGLAYEELEGLAEVNRVSEEFWLHMLEAARRMNLPECVERCQQRLGKTS